MRWRKEKPMRVMLDHTLAVGVSLWGLVVGALTMLDESPSRTIAALPRWEAIAWSVAIIMASATVLLGLFVTRSVLMVSRALFLHAIVTTIYWISIVYVVGWAQGGAMASFLFVIAAVEARQAEVLRDLAFEHTRTERR